MKIQPPNSSDDRVVEASRHPLQIMADFFHRHPDIVETELSLYVYRPQTSEDEREIIHVKPEHLSEKYLELLGRIEPEQEIAFHSRVYVKTRGGWEFRHLPMIDFKTELLTEANHQIVRLAEDFFCEEFDIFSSGRSFHFYGLTLLTQLQWRRFMGRTLLLNLPGQPDVVDVRWVGHRLIAGYSSLRWSCNNPHYKQEPRLNQVWKRSGVALERKQNPELPDD